MAIIDKGEILLEAEPPRAIAALRGKLWRRTVAAHEVEALRGQHAVVSTKLLGGRTVVHVFADATPPAGFEPVEPGLEDVYFSVMGGHHRGVRA